MQTSARQSPGAPRLVPRAVDEPKGVNPLIRQLGLKQVLERDTAPADPVQDLEGAQVESALAGHVRQAWARNKLAKERINQKLLSDLRARRGIYSPQEIADIQASNGGLNIVWSPLTEVKCRAGSAWVRDIVLPVGEQPRGLEPTPLAELPRPMMEAIVRRALTQAQDVLVQAQQAGGGVMDPQEFRDLVRELGEKLRNDAEKTYKKLAKKRAEKMEQTIEDRMVQGNFYQAMDDFIEDFTTYPAAILKGPIYKRDKKLKWGAGWRPVVTNEAVPWWDRVSPFDTYPAPGSQSPQKGDFIERVRFQRDELYDLKGIDGYKDDQIDAALMDYSNGHMEGWMWTESERQRLEQETLYMWLSPPGVIDALNFWGRVPGWKLMSWGVTGDLEETKDYECNVVLCGRYVLYAAINPHPLGRRPYRKACYDAIPGAFWGRSIPDLAKTPQQMCNGIACAIADNLGIASGPMMWTHVDRLADGEQSLEAFPWKNYQLKSDPTQGVNPGIGFFQPDDRTASLMALHEKWEIKADDSTGIPRYTYGNERAGGSADTATGLGMLMTNAAKGLRRGISNIDMNVIEATTYDTFVNEMLYNPDESIKGDCVVVARGAAAILIRESAQQRRIQFLGMTANPIDAAIITAKYRAALLRETAAAMELPVDEVVPSEDDLEKQAAQQAQQQQQQIEMMDEQQKQMFNQQIVLEQVKEEAKGAREQAAQTNSVIADLVKEAVTSAMLAQQANKPKKIAHKYNAEGQITESEATE
jgi:hypothetical protein